MCGVVSASQDNPTPCSTKLPIGNPDTRQFTSASLHICQIKNGITVDKMVRQYYWHYPIYISPRPFAFVLIPMQSFGTLPADYINLNHSYATDTRDILEFLNNFLYSSILEIPTTISSSTVSESR